jgi:hypothetical protein
VAPCQLNVSPYDLRKVCGLGVILLQGVPTSSSIKHVKTYAIFPLR